MMVLTSVTLHNITDRLTRENECFGPALEAAAAAFKDAEKIFAEPGFDEHKGWKIDTKNDDGDVVYTRQSENGMQLAIKTELPMDVETVMRETWNGVPGLPAWNTNINFANTIAVLTPYSDIVRYGNNDVLIVAGREFLSSRIYRKTDEKTYIMVSRSFELDSIPVMEGKVRAHVHIGAVRFRAHPTDPQKTVTDVLMCADLKGLLPKFLINQVMGKLMLLDSEANKKHFIDLVEKRDKQEAD